jgi:hypothetical protein
MSRAGPKNGDFVKNYFQDSGLYQHLSLLPAPYHVPEWQHTAKFLPKSGRRE